jgi:hypothetical protein
MGLSIPQVPLPAKATGRGDAYDSSVPTDYREPHVDCDNCGAHADLPTPPGAHYSVGRKKLAEAGWTYRPNHAERPLVMLPHTYIWNCPDCPSVD